MNIFYKIRKLITPWKITLTQVNLVIVNVLLLTLITLSNDLDHFVKSLGQIAISICMILNAVSGLYADTGDGTEIGDIDV